MSLAHRFAVENDNIEADMVEASEFPHLVQKYAVMAVPKTVVNGRGVVDGAMPEPTYAAAIAKAAMEVAASG